MTVNKKRVLQGVLLTVGIAFNIWGLLTLVQTAGHDAGLNVGLTYIDKIPHIIHKYVIVVITMMIGILSLSNWAAQLTGKKRNVLSIIFCAYSTILTIPLFLTFILCFFRAGGILDFDMVNMICDDLMKRVFLPYDVSTVFTLGGYGTGQVKEDGRVLGAASSLDMKERLEPYGVEFSPHEPPAGIVGASGILVGLSQQYGIDAACIIGETSGFFADYKAGMRLLTILERLLGLELDMSELVRELAWTVDFFARGRGVTVEYESRPEPLYMSADRTLVEQMLLNLLSNSLLSLPDGGHVRLSLARRGEWAVISVDDDGCGIAPGRFADIEDGEGSLSAPPGLGLPLARSIAELHGGSASLSDRPALGCGTEFVLTLPVCR